MRLFVLLQLIALALLGVVTAVSSLLLKDPHTGIMQFGIVLLLVMLGAEFVNGRRVVAGLAPLIIPFIWAPYRYLDLSDSPTALQLLFGVFTLTIVAMASGALFATARAGKYKFRWLLAGATCQALAGATLLYFEMRLFLPYMVATIGGAMAIAACALLARRGRAIEPTPAV